MNDLARFVTALVAGAAVSLLGMVLGLWWVPFPAGVAIGAVLPRARWALPAGAGAGLVAWTVPLVVTQQQYGLGPTATSLAAIMGFTGAADIPVILTCMVGLLLGLTGAWAGSAGRGLYVALPRPPRPAAKLRDKRLEVVDPVRTKR